MGEDLRAARVKIKTIRNPVEKGKGIDFGRTESYSQPTTAHPTSSCIPGRVVPNFHSSDTRSAIKGHRGTCTTYTRYVASGW